MQTAKLGTTAVDVTRIGFGCASIGNLYRRVPRADAEAALQQAWEAGIRYFDTAPYYGHGLSERRLGDFMRQFPRESYTLSTKVGRLLAPVAAADVPDHGYVDPLPFRIHYDYSHDGIMRSLEASLHRLGLNRIDIAYVHDIGVLTHGVDGNQRHLADLLGGGLRALQKLKAEGVIRAIGLGVNETGICLEIMDHVALDCILLAGRYTLLDRSAEHQLLARCAGAQTSLVIGGVFNSGILATGAGPNAHFDYAPPTPDVCERVTQMAAVAARHHVPLAAASLQFPLRNPQVASVLIGTANPSSLRRNLDLINLTLPTDLWGEMDAYAITENGPMFGF